MEVGVFMRENRGGVIGFNEEEEWLESFNPSSIKVNIWSMLVN